MDLIKHIKPLGCGVEWSVWKRKIRDLLDYYEGALDAVDGKLIKPNELGENASNNDIKKYKEQYDLYRKGNSFTKSMITAAVTDAVYQKIMDKNTAHEVWETLKKNFEAAAEDQLFKHCTDLFSFSWSNNADVSGNIAKLNTLWNELNGGLRVANKPELPNLLLIGKVLQILPDSFETFKSSWMLMSKNEDNTLDELLSQLCMFERNFLTKCHEENKVKQEERVTREALSVRQNNDKKTVKQANPCHYCKKKGHWIRECKQWIQNGHPAKPKENANPKKTKGPIGTTATFVQDNACTSIEDGSSVWWLDNGATKHMTKSSQYFVNYKRFDIPKEVNQAGHDIDDI